VHERALKQRSLFGTAGYRSAAPSLARYASIVKPATTPGRPAIWTRRLLRRGLAAGPVCVTGFLVEGAARDGYRPLRHPVSPLALGPRGWIQAANFAVTEINHR